MAPTWTLSGRVLLSAAGLTLLALYVIKVGDESILYMALVCLYLCLPGTSPYQHARGTREYASATALLTLVCVPAVLLAYVLSGDVITAFAGVPLALIILRLANLLRRPSMAPNLNS